MIHEVLCISMFMILTNGLPPTSNSSENIYNVVINNTKCPYVSQIFHLKNELDFLKECKYESMKNMTTIIDATPTSLSNARCFLFYNAFLQCGSINVTNTNKVTELLKKYQFNTNITQVCNNLGKMPQMDNTTGSIIALKIIKSKDKCIRLCTNFEEDVYPICNVSAVLTQINLELIKINTSENITNTKKPVLVAKTVTNIIQGNNVPNADRQNSNINQGINNIPKFEKVNHAITENTDKVAVAQKVAKVEEVEPVLPQDTAPNVDSTQPVDNIPVTSTETSLKGKNIDEIVDALPAPDDVNMELDFSKPKPETEKTSNDIDINDNALEEDYNPDPNTGNAEKPKPNKLEEPHPGSINSIQDPENEQSYFFSYFMTICVIFVLCYVGYHNKQKILALILEGRKGRRTSRTRRPNSANYHKLDSNLEEAVTSACNKNTTQVIY